MGIITKYKNNNNFHTTIVNCIFQFKCDKTEVMAYTILTKLLSKTNKKYSEIDIFAKEKLNRYIMNLSVLNQSINDVYFINYSCILPGDGVVSDFDICDSIDFLMSTIYEPNIDNVELFEREKRLYIETLLNNYKSVEFIAEKNMLDLLDKDCKFNKIKYKDIENIQNLTIDDIINFYNKYIKNIKPKIFIYGNCDKKKLENIITSYLDKLQLKAYKLIKDYNSFSYINELINKTESTKFYQSIVYMVYNMKDYKESDFYKLYMVNLLLSNPSSEILFNNLRKKNNLVYASGSSVMIRNGILIMKAVTSRKNIILVKAVMEKVVKDLKNINKYKDNINRILEKFESNIIREKDNFYIEPSDIINKYFASDNTTEEILEILKNITLDELLECINRLEIKCIYTLEGVA